MYGSFQFIDFQTGTSKIFLQRKYMAHKNKEQYAKVYFSGFLKNFEWQS